MEPKGNACIDCCSYDASVYLWAEIRKPIRPINGVATVEHVQGREQGDRRLREEIMGTREVYKEKLRRGNLDYDPTMNPGLGSARCPRCLFLLNLNPEKGEWTITSILHDAADVAGSGIGGLLSAVHAFNTGIPYLQNTFTGSRRLSFLVGVPLLLGYSGVGDVFGGYVLPMFAQLTVTSYYASSSASHYGISMLTRHIEDYHLSRTLKEEAK